MSTWVEILVDPDFVETRLAKTEPRSSLRAATLLLAGRFAEYERDRQAGKWPPIGGGTKRASTSDALISALSLYIAGDDSMRLVLDRLRTSEIRSDQRTFATVLTTLSLANSDKTEESLQLLNAELAHSQSPLEESLLSLHLSARLIDAQRFEEAVRVALTARSTAQTSHLRRHWKDVLTAVSIGNEFTASVLGRMSLPNEPPNSVARWSSSALMRVEALQTQGLAAHVSQLFENIMEDVNTTRITWRAGDPVLQPILTALLRAECLGDAQTQIDIRRIAGRYQLANSVGSRTAQSADGFRLLRRARDRDGIIKASAAYWRRGPLSALRDLADQLTGLPKEQIVDPINAGVLSRIADVVPVDVAEKVWTMIEGNSLTPSLLELAGSIAPLVGIGTNQAISRRIRDAIRDNPNPILRQEAGRSLRRLDSRQLGPEETRAWLEFGEELLRSEEGWLLAADVLSFARSTEALRVREVVTAQFDERPSLFLAALATALDLDVTSTTLASFIHLSADAVAKTVSDAHRGRWGIGSVDASLVLAESLFRVGDNSDWSPLLELLFDPKVAANNKISCLDLLAARVEEIPPSEKEHIRASLGDMTAADEPLLSEARGLSGAKLRLQLALDSVDASEALISLLELSTNSNAAVRADASRILPYSSSSLGESVVASIALALSMDDQVQVQAEAGGAIARMLSEISSESISGLFTRRLSDLIRAEGALVPATVLQNLVRAQVAPTSTRKLATSLGRYHPSATVRRLAGEVESLNS